MAQNIYFYNNTSLAEAITDAHAIVGKQTTSNIVEFQAKYGNIYDVPNTYDNIIEFTGNNSKITWDKVNGKDVMTTNDVHIEGDTVTTTVTGVLCFAGIAETCRNILLAFGMREKVAAVERDYWGPLYPILEELASMKNVSAANLEYARIACVVGADGKVRIPEALIDDVASALARAQLTQNNFSQILEAGQQYPRSAINLSNDWVPVWNAFASDYSTFISTHSGAAGAWNMVVKNSVLVNARNELIKALAERHLDYNSFSYDIFIQHIDYTYTFFVKITAVLIQPVISIITKEILDTNKIYYTMNQADGQPVLQVRSSLNFDSVYNHVTPNIEIGAPDQYADYRYVLGVRGGNNPAGASAWGSPSSIVIGDPPSYIEYIGDPLTNAPWRNQYPAWLYNLTNGLLPLSPYDPAADPAADPQAGAQTGDMPDHPPYFWQLTDPIEIPPINPYDPPIKPDSPEPKPEFPIFPDFPSYDANKLFTVHTINQSNMNTLGGYLWSSSFASLIEHMFSEPIHAVLGLHELHYGGDISTGANEEIKLGAFGSGAHGHLVTNRYLEFSCGSIKVNEHYGNVEDYDPYTKLQLYLPYIGYVPISTNECMGKTMTIKYGIDVYTGGCIAKVFVVSNGVTQELYNFHGQCGCQLPVTSADYSSLISRPVLGAALGAVTGGAVGAITGGLGGLASAKINYNRSNGFNSNTGPMGRQKPMLIYERPIAFNAASYPAFYGNPTNWTVKLSQCSGFTRVKEIHIDKTKATESERQEIERLLKEGVII